MAIEVTKYKFKKGQKVHLDEIYNIQGLAFDWFTEDFSAHNSKDSRKGMTDYLVITKDIEFEIKVKTK